MTKFKKPMMEIKTEKKLKKNFKKMTKTKKIMMNFSKKKNKDTMSLTNTSR